MINPESIRNLLINLEKFELALNVVGYIPVVGTVSAYVRNRYACIEAISGIALAIFSIAETSSAQIYI